jgi:zinc finger MYM-type protein 1
MVKRKIHEENSITKFFKSSTNTERLIVETHTSNQITQSNISSLSITQPPIFQTDPAIGLNVYEFNKRAIQPVIKFPQNCEKPPRKFISSWYSKHSWLEYSISRNRAFCHVCRLFSDNKDYVYSKIGFNDWKHAIERFDAHQKTEAHKNATISFKSRIQNDLNSTSINVEIESYRKTQVKKNREYIGKIIETVQWLSQQGLAFRGHREDIESNNRGNFLELLELRSKDLPILLDNTIKYSYSSKETQNEIIELLGSNIKSAISEECQGKPFSVIMDETCDVAKHEQCAIIIRYADEKLTIQERFIGFAKTATTSGKDLFEILEPAIKELGLSFSSLLVGQGYDGASNMSGQFKGLASRVQSKAPQAIYVHCLCHRLNLSLQAACSELVEVRNCLGTVNSLYNFISGSAKRAQLFQNSQLQQHGTTLKNHGETRWGSRKNSIHSCVKTYEFVLETLDYIHLTDKTPSASNSFSLLNAAKEFEFLFVLNVLFEVFDRTGILSDALQDSELEIDRSIRLKSTTISSLSDINTEEAFNIIYDKCLTIANENDILEPTLPRQRHVPARLKDSLPQIPHYKSIIEKYKDLYFKIIVTVIKEINERFDDKTLDQILKLARMLKGSCSIAEVEQVENLNYYNDILNFNDLKKEMYSWKSCLSSFKDNKDYDINSILSIAKLIVEKNLKKDYPQIEKLMRIYLAIPATSVAAERAFSVLKRIKTWLRNSMEQDRLSSLSIINIEKDFSKEVDIENIIDQFASLKDRRLQFF